MTSMSEKVKKEIYDKKIKVLPCWFFILRKALLFGIFIVSLVIGVFAFSVLLTTFDAFWMVQHMTVGRQIGLVVIPVLWIVLLSCLLTISYFQFRKTPGGYRHPTTKLFIALFIASAKGGSIVHFLGWSHRLHRLV